MRERQVEQRRAIEALRSGVPNRDAVRALGSTQAEIDARFAERLQRARAGDAAGALLVSGDFGSGKSHLLQYLQHRALEANFVVSRIVISKETPLHDPLKLYRSAIADATLPDRRGDALTEIAAGLGFDGRAFGELYHWTGTVEAGLDERFAATLFLYRALRNDDQELADRILRFWAGDPIGVADLRKGLRQCNEATTWTLPKVTVRDLALQRFRFTAALTRAAGYAGWVFLLDEVELIGRYSLLQRAGSYAEIARWVDGDAARPMPGVTGVLAMVADFDSAVLEPKNDLEGAPNRLRARGREGDEEAAALAERGMQIILDEALPLDSVGAPQREAAYRKLKAIHAEAYNWQPPDVESPEALGTRPMRQYVRWWIQQWDLRRLDPSYQPQIEAETLTTEYGEDPDLETGGEADAGYAPE